MQGSSHSCTAQCSRMHRSLSKGSLKLAHPNTTVGPRQVIRQLHSGSCSKENPCCSHQRYFCTALLCFSGSMAPTPPPVHPQHRHSLSPKQDLDMAEMSCHTLNSFTTPYTHVLLLEDGHVLYK